MGDLADGNSTVTVGHARGDTAGTGPADTPHPTTVPISNARAGSAVAV